MRSREEENILANTLIITLEPRTSGLDRKWSNEVLAEIGAIHSSPSSIKTDPNGLWIKNPELKSFSAVKELPHPIAARTSYIVYREEHNLETNAVYRDLAVRVQSTTDEYFRSSIVFSWTNNYISVVFDESQQGALERELLAFFPWINFDLLVVNPAYRNQATVTFKQLLFKKGSR